MPTNIEPIYDREQRHASDEGGLGDVDHIRDQINQDFASMGQIVDDLADIPVEGDVRANGIFTDPADAEEWLGSGGLLLHDENGQTIPLPWVWLIHSVNDLGEDEYQIFLGDGSS